MRVEVVLQVLVAEETTCLSPSLSTMELRRGLDVVSVSMLKSPISIEDLVRDEGSSSRLDSRLVMTDESLEGGL